MNESTQDIERRRRLQEWFQSNPDIWNDLAEEIKMSIYNEKNTLKARTCTNREWSAGYVFGQEEILGLQTWLRKVWATPAHQQK